MVGGGRERGEGGSKGKRFVKETRCGFHVAAVGLVKGMRVLLSRARRGLKGGGGGDGEGRRGRGIGGIWRPLCRVCVP